MSPDNGNNDKENYGRGEQCGYDRGKEEGLKQGWDDGYLSAMEEFKQELLDMLRRLNI
jgi:flagellar biosynthesis/type III secretory pathway protein FliH